MAQSAKRSIVSLASYNLAMKKELWVKNFSIKRCSYHLIVIFTGSVDYSHKVLFGKERYLKDFFFRFEGQDLEGGYFQKEQLRDLIDNSVKLVLEKPNHILKIHKETYEMNDQYFAFSHRILGKDISKLSNKELGKLYLDLIGWQDKTQHHSILLTWFLDSDGEDYSNILINKAKKYIEKSGKKINFAQAFSLLTTKPENSLGITEEIESFQVLKLISGDKRAKEIFIGLQEFAEIPNKLDEKIKEAITKHHEKWHWMPFDYLGPSYGVDYYLQVWSGLLRQGVNPDKEIRDKQQRPEKVRQRRERLIKDLSIGDEDRKLFDIGADIVFLKGYRKDRTFFGFFVLDKILKEMAKRLFLSLNQMHLLAPWELEDTFLKGKEVDLNDLNKRLKLSIISRSHGKTEILTGEEAKKFFESKNIKKIKIDKNIKELVGTTASAGQAKGNVKIVNVPAEMGKMEEGDVMVAHTTYPSLVPAMRKASAIITEDGGITCHAAIISRELGTPCIVGIKIATQVLQDGMKVTVNADEGLVKIL